MFRRAIQRISRSKIFWAVLSLLVFYAVMLLLTYVLDPRATGQTAFVMVFAVATLSAGGLILVAVIVAMSAIAQALAGLVSRVRHRNRN